MISLTCTNIYSTLLLFVPKSPNVCEELPPYSVERRIAHSYLCTSSRSSWRYASFHAFQRAKGRAWNFHRHSSFHFFHASAMLTMLLMTYEIHENRNPSLQEKLVMTRLTQHRRFVPGVPQIRESILTALWRPTDDWRGPNARGALNAAPAFFFIFYEFTSLVVFFRALCWLIILTGAQCVMFFFFFRKSHISRQEFATSSPYEADGSWPPFSFSVKNVPSCVPKHVLPKV